MRLKHLTLQGYKSFATRTEFLFPTGITAVVGPNGSGKSNVADAIRWVLGEQRMRTLRGKSSADMIFAGGRRRARSGMAEVALTLDNSDGWLPIEFSEVTISRRAYRSGENEYLINGARVRLRDVAEMLAESGLSQRTYTVIGQGLVDAALSLRPQERRMLFEGAAGISLYRARREEAIRRLDETSRNLERVHDIVNEIVPRLHRLEREAGRVEEHRRLTAHLERLQRTWYGYHWGRQQVVLERVLERASVLESGLAEQQGKAFALSERLTRLRQQESGLRASLRDWHREGADLHARTDKTQRELAVAEERSRLLMARREELLAELELLSGQQEAQAEGVAESRVQVGQLERGLIERQGRLADLEQEWATIQERIREPGQRRVQVEQELRARRAGLEGLNRALLKTRAEVARLAGEQEALGRMRDAWLSYETGVQALLQIDLDGVIGPLATLMQVPSDWEHAVEAALGADLQAIVVERASLVERVRGALQSAGGRVTLLPLDGLRPPLQLPPAALRAADVVACDESVRPAVETVLGAVALCADLPAARALLPDMPPGSRCVTSTGIVLRADGALSVGQVGTGGVLVDERAWRELPARLEEPHQRCQEIEEQQRLGAEQVAALETELEGLDRQVAAASEEEARALRDRLGQARTEVAVAKASFRSQQVALQREMTLLDRLRAQMAARRQRVGELEAEHGAIVARVKELRLESSRMDTLLHAVRARIQPAEEELVHLGEEQTALEEQERRARDRVRETETRHGRIQLEVARCRDELRLLARRIEEDLGLVELELAESVTAQTPLPLRPLVSQLPIVEELPAGLEEEIQRLKARFRRLGAVNPNAPDEYAETQERHFFLTEQSADLEAASTQLHQVVAELDELMETAFQETFDAVAARFSETFPILFNGGAARLELTDPGDLMNTGVDIVARPPGKRAQRLALLSGGERALTAAALLFSLLHVNPTPFCVLDEVDAMLDEANVGRFRVLLEELSQQTQFVVITHNRVTVEAADTIYGVSMGAEGVSQVVSLQLENGRMES
ncbi:MAG: AAA family ATPase [Chloroflexota bacterium]|nr:AAA family ATPase [Chloroflexota bacterium]